MKLAPPANLRSTWLIAYDVVADRRRARVARRLERQGERVQKSVFVARLSTAEVERLEEELQRLIDPREDVVDLLPLCAHCRARGRHLGQGPGPEPPRWVVL